MSALLVLSGAIILLLRDRVADTMASRASSLRPSQDPPTTSGRRRELTPSRRLVVVVGYGWIAFGGVILFVALRG
jgi:hypothetical protein